MSTTLIAVDGHSFNGGLHKKAASLAAKGKNLPTFYSKLRLRVDYKKLREVLGADDEKLNGADSNLALVYYTGQPEKKSDRMMGRVYKWMRSGGYGFIREINGGNYFVHARSVERDGRNRDGYVTLEPGQIVSFDGRTDDDGREVASSVRVETSPGGRDAYFGMRQDSFLKMLEESGYEVVRCRSAKSGFKSKHVDVRVVRDAMGELTRDTDQLILVSDDPVYLDLIQTLKADGVRVTVVAFRSNHAEELMREATDSIVLDDILRDIVYTPMDRTASDDDEEANLDDQEDFADEDLDDHDDTDEEGASDDYPADEDDAVLSRAQVHAVSQNK